MTVRQLLSWGAERLGKAREGLPAPAREARWLLAHALGRTEAWLVAHPEEEVASAAEELFHHWVERRRVGVPAHYLIGTCPFWGRDFLVTPAVLLPRPETELLMAAALALPLPATPWVLDVGTGSGCLAVSLAAAWPAARVVAVDVSWQALGVARANAARHGATVRLVAGDLGEACRGGFHLVVANLPYLSEAELANLPPEVRDWEPRLALAGGANGEELLRHLVADLSRLLAPTGHALLEVGAGQAQRLAPVWRGAGLAEEKVIPDAAGIPRVLHLRLATSHRHAPG